MREAEDRKPESVIVLKTRILEGKPWFIEKK
jgi:hypothetical protein